MKRKKVITSYRTYNGDSYVGIPFEMTTKSMALRRLTLSNAVLIKRKEMPTDKNYEDAIREIYQKREKRKFLALNDYPDNLEHKHEINLD